MNNATQSFLGRYRLVKVLGQGAMGVVYEAVDTRLNRSVAIKTVLRSHLVDEHSASEYTTRFEREAQAAARLAHPHIVTVHDFGEHEDITYIVMEFVRGRELAQAFADGEPFTLIDTLRLMGELLSALDYAHAQGVVHRDVKPANVMLDHAGHVKLTDFGVARVASTTQDRTIPGTLVGTPSYMAPEQVLGMAVGSRADIFAAGVILYQWITGQRPFAGEGPFAVQRKIVQDDPPPPTQLNPQLPAALDAVLARALAKDPEQRYATAGAFARDLERIGAALAPGFSSPRPASPTAATPGPAGALGTTRHPGTTASVARSAPPSHRPPPSPAPAAAAAPAAASTMAAAAPRTASASPARSPSVPQPARPTPRAATTSTHVPAPAASTMRRTVLPLLAGAAVALLALAAWIRWSAPTPAPTAVPAHDSSPRPAASAAHSPPGAVPPAAALVTPATPAPTSAATGPAAPPADPAAIPSANPVTTTHTSPAATTAAAPAAAPAASPAATTAAMSPAVPSATPSAAPATERTATPAATPAVGPTQAPSAETPLRPPTRFERTPPDAPPTVQPPPAGAQRPRHTPAPTPQSRGERNAPAAATGEAPAPTPAPRERGEAPFGSRCGDLLQRMQIGEPLTPEQTQYFQTRCTR